jgi:tRNA-dihydrouridine synthase
MSNINPNTEQKIYLAPIQGFTDYSFRAAFASAFEMPDAAFAPFINCHESNPKMFRDVLPERNEGVVLIPQILGNDPERMLKVVNELQQMGYNEVNINMGCPYPMVTKKGMGAGLLNQPEKIRQMLDVLTSRSDCRLSVKMRLGFQQANECLSLIPVLNQFPLSEVIVHGRTAGQMYTGEVDIEMFTRFYKELKMPVCYNGNIFTLDDVLQLQQKFSDINRWMLGRGLIANPLLLHEIKTGERADEANKIKAISSLHDALLQQYETRLSGTAHIFNKIKPFWEYFSPAFEGYEKALKKIRKTEKYEAYLAYCNELFSSKLKSI